MSTALGAGGPALALGSHPDGAAVDSGLGWAAADASNASNLFGNGPMGPTLSAGAISSINSSAFSSGSQDDQQRQSGLLRTFRSEGSRSGAAGSSQQSRGRSVMTSPSLSMAAGPRSISGSSNGNVPSNHPSGDLPSGDLPSMSGTASYQLDYPSEPGFNVKVDSRAVSQADASSTAPGSRLTSSIPRGTNAGSMAERALVGSTPSGELPYSLEFQSGSLGDNSDSVVSGSLRWQGHCGIRMDNTVNGTSMRSFVSMTSRPSIGNVTIKPQLLRGVPTSRTFVNFGILWRQSPCDMRQEDLQPLYQYSAPCNEIDTFISHAWGTPWWQKYLALLTHFYGRTAAYSGCWTLMWCCALDFANMLPQAEVETSGSNFALKLSPWSAVPIVVSVMALILGPRLTGQQRDKNLFFDVVCINQIDDSEKAEGINHLAGFLNKSREMLVLWSPETLQRMWCVFELAIFCALHGKERKITWCPVFLHSLLLIQYLTVSLIFVANEIRHCSVNTDGSQEWFASNWFIAVYVVLLIPAIYLWDMGRSFMRQRHDFAGTVEAFDIHEANCRDEGDRRYLLRNIRHWYGSEDIFNKEVQGPLAAQIKQAINSVDADYVTVLLASAPQFCYSLEFLVAYTRSGMEWQDLLKLTLLQVVSSFCLFPVWLKIGWHGMSVFRRSAGTAIRDLGFSAFLTLTWAATYAFLWTATRWFTASLPRMLICTVLWTVGTYLAFAPMLWRSAWAGVARRSRGTQAALDGEAMSPRTYGRDLQKDDIIPKDRVMADPPNHESEVADLVCLFPDHKLSDKIIEERPSEVADRQSEAMVWSERSTMTCLKSQCQSVIGSIDAVRESEDVDEAFNEFDEEATVYSL